MTRMTSREIRAEACGYESYQLEFESFNSPGHELVPRLTYLPFEISGVVADKKSDTLLRSPAKKLPMREVGQLEVRDYQTGLDCRLSRHEVLFLRQLQQQVQDRESAESDAILPVPGSAPARRVSCAAPSPSQPRSDAGTAMSNSTLFMV